MAQTTLDQRMLGVGTALTDHTITASDVITFADVGDSNLTKKDTVQGVLDLAGGAWTFLATATASSTTDIEWKTQFDASTYGSYKILFENTKLSATGETLQVIFSTNGGSSYDTTSGNYKDQTMWRRGNGDVGGQSASDETGINLYVKTNSGTDAEDFVSGELTIFNPSTSDITSCHVFSVGKYNDNYFYVMSGMPFHNVSADVDAIKIVTSGGSSNIAVGTFRLYGLKIA